MTPPPEKASAFTDEDVRRLKNHIAVHEYTNFKREDWEALLARLEAAESIVHKILQAKQHAGCQLRASDLSIEAWKKAAGRE